MNIDKYVEEHGIDRWDFDNKYTFICNEIGLDKLKRFFPLPLEELREKLKKDVHLNNVPLRMWDYYGEYIAPLLCNLGITAQSPAGRVCILKQAVRLTIDQIG